MVRLEYEADERRDCTPALRDAPDEALANLDRLGRYWLGVAVINVMRKSRCPPEAAPRVVTELRQELEDTLSEAEMNAISLREALAVPPEKLPAFLRPPARCRNAVAHPVNSG